LRYCSRCIYPENHPLHLTFDEEGVCSGCRVHEEKDQFDWRERMEFLRELVREYRSSARTTADCIVPVSGARDSYFIVHVVKHVLGLHPLLVTYNKHYNTEVGIRNLAYLRTLFGCDIMTMTVAPQKVKRVTRESIRQRGSIYWHCLAGQTVFPVQIAVRMKIPLIIWGAHQGVDQVGMFSHADEVEMTRKYRKEHDLMGLEAEDLLADSDGLTEDDIRPYLYPHDAELAAVGVRGIYLNNYVRWDSKAQHEAMIQLYGYESAVQSRTFDTYNDVDCFHYSGLHDEIKYRKWGYGKATDHACRELRLRRLTREDAVHIASKYQANNPLDSGQFFKWIEIDAEELWRNVDRFRDLRAWRRTETGGWERTDSVTWSDPAGLNDVRLPHLEPWEFQLTAPRTRREPAHDYVLIGRGFVDREQRAGPADEGAGQWQAGGS
jgi:N-acetyl sugar amidotransferase